MKTWKGQNTKKKLKRETRCKRSNLEERRQPYGNQSNEEQRNPAAQEQALLLQCYPLLASATLLDTMHGKILHLLRTLALAALV